MTVFVVTFNDGYAFEFLLGELCPEGIGTTIDFLSGLHNGVRSIRERDNKTIPSWPAVVFTVIVITCMTIAISLLILK